MPSLPLFPCTIVPLLLNSPDLLFLACPSHISATPVHYSAVQGSHSVVAHRINRSASASPSVSNSCMQYIHCRHMLANGRCRCVQPARSIWESRHGGSSGGRGDGGGGGGNCRCEWRLVSCVGAVKCDRSREELARRSRKRGS